MTSIFLGALIFGYAGWMMFRFVKKSKKGACAGCPDHASCFEKQCHDINNVNKVD